MRKSSKSRRLHTDALTRKNHLEKRDKWDLKTAPPEWVHLMVRCMEAWIAADPNALASYYGKSFRVNSLPNCTNLEDVPKTDLYDKLAKATKDTSKGAYAKIKHASKLLGLIDPNQVAVRCPRFATFARWLDEQISNA